MKNLRFVLPLAVAVLLCACAPAEVLPGGLAPVAPAALGQPDSKTVALTIYRPRKMFGAALRPTVRMNGQDLATITNGKAFRTHIAPGRYVFDVDGHKSGAQIEAKPGEAYYFLVGLEPGLFAGNGVLTLVAPQQGLFESQALPPLDKDNIDASAFR